MTLINVVAHGLTHQVTGNGVAGKTVVVQQGPFVAKVFLVAGGGIDVEMVAPAGELYAIVAHFLDQRREFFEGKVGPLAGEQGDRAGHGE